MEDIDPSRMAIIDLKGANTIASDDGTDWVCGHWDETLLHRASEWANDGPVFRCPHCFGFSHDVVLLQIARSMAWHYKEHKHQQTPGDRVRYAGAEEQARRSSLGFWRHRNPMPLSE